MAKYRISGVPITEGKKLVGIITNRDLKFETDFSKKIKESMTAENLVTATEGITLDEAKKILAYEVTKMVHGEEEANKCKSAAEAVFGGGGVSADMPTTVIPDVVGMGVLDMLVATGLLPSKGEARRLVTQNGLSINDEKYTDPNGVVTADMIKEDGMIIKKGKKVFHRVTLS